MNVPDRTANAHLDAARAQDRNAATCSSSITRRAYEAAAAAHRQAARALYHLDNPAHSDNVTFKSFRVLIQFHAAAADAAAHRCDGQMGSKAKLESREETFTHRDVIGYFVDTIESHINK